MLYYVPNLILIRAIRFLQKHFDSFLLVKDKKFFKDMTSKHIDLGMKKTIQQEIDCLRLFYWIFVFKISKVRLIYFIILVFYRKKLIKSGKC